MLPNANMETFHCSQAACHHFSNSLFQSDKIDCISFYPCQSNRTAKLCFYDKIKLAPQKEASAVDHIENTGFQPEPFKKDKKIMFFISPVLTDDGCRDPS